jgi:hypothetical protein
MSKSQTQSDNFRESDTPKKPRVWKWQFLLYVGLVVSLAGRTGRAVTKALEPGLGYPAALVLGVVAVGALAGLMAWAVFGLTKPGKHSGG